MIMDGGKKGHGYHGSKKGGHDMGMKKNSKEHRY